MCSTPVACLPAAVPAGLQTASDMYSPVTGEVVEINQALVDDPAKVSNGLQHTHDNGRGCNAHGDA